MSLQNTEGAQLPEIQEHRDSATQTPGSPGLRLPKAASTLNMGECVLILRVLFMSWDLEIFVVKSCVDGHPNSPLPLQLAHGCLSGHQQIIQV